MRRHDQSLCAKKQPGGQAKCVRRQTSTDKCCLKRLMHHALGCSSKQTYAAPRCYTPLHPGFGKKSSIAFTIHKKNSYKQQLPYQSLSAHPKLHLSRQVCMHVSVCKHDAKHDALHMSDVAGWPWWFKPLGGGGGQGWRGVGSPPGKMFAVAGAVTCCAV